MTTADERAQHYLKLRDQGLTYGEIAAGDGVTREAVRNSIRRYTTKATQGIKVEAPKTAHDLKIFVYDIERAPMLREVEEWDLKQYAGYGDPKTIKRRSRMVSWAGKFLDGPMLYSSEWDHGSDAMINSIWQAFDAADVIVGYNSQRFDNLHVHGEFFLRGIDDPSPYRSIDLYRLLKSGIKLDSFKLDHVSQLIFDDHKVDHGSYMRMLRGCIEGDPEERQLFASYNKKDVALTERLYYQLRSRIKNHPPVLFESNGTNCNACGSEDLVQTGWKLALTLRYPMLRCQSCGWQGRSVKGGERISLVSTS